MKKQLKKNWWYIGVNGLVAIIVGLIALFLPKESTFLFIRILGGIAAVGGISLIFVDIVNYRKHRSHGIWFAQGFVLLAPGLLFLVAPQFVINLTSIFLGIWAILAGLFHIFTIFSLREIFKNYLVSMINGILMIAIGVLLIANPIKVASAITVFIGIFLLIYGAWQIYMAFRIHKELNDWQEPEVIE